MRRKANGSTGGFDPTIGDAAFAVGYVTRYVEDYARTQNLHPALLAERVAAILYSQWAGSKYHLPPVRPEAPEGSSPVGKVEVVKRPRNVVQRVKRKMSARGRAAIRRAQKARWAKQKGKRKKRKLSLKQLASMRANIAKGRQARLEQLAA